MKIPDTGGYQQRRSLKTFMMDAIGGPRGVTAGDIPIHEVMQIKTNKTAIMKTYLL